MLIKRKPAAAVASGLVALLFAVPGLALAGDLNVGAGLRTSFNIFEDAAPNGTDDSNDFDLDSVRLYTSGNVRENVAFEFNTGYQASTNSVEVLDAVAKFEFSDAFNVWAGRFLPPSDRSNLSGPYFLGAWNFPLAQRYPQIFAGRDEGVAIWGQQGGGKFKYQLGLFEGPDGLVATGEDETLVAARVVANFLDPEPGYYNSSTYFGDKEIFAVGAVVQSFDSGTGSNVDVLYETGMGDGTLTLEGAVYNYDEFAGQDGDGSFVLASYLFPGGWQPTARIQTFDIDVFDPVSGMIAIDTPETDVTEFGFNYIIDGHNARVSFVAGNAEVDGGADFDFIQLGLQLQI